MMHKAQHGSIFDRLTDTSLYTGAHKHRFDENGNGRGLAGRDRVAKGSGFIAGAPGGAVADLSQITRPNLQTAGAAVRGPGGPPLVLYQRSPSMNGSSPLPSPGAPSPGVPSPGTPSPRPGSVGRGALRVSNSGALRTGTPSRQTPSQGQGQRASDCGDRRSSIFDRLNDPSNYTGMHRERFSQDGRGRGAAGRTMANSYVNAADNVRR
ncbi:hypothetical protein PLESTB_001251900 [Pleodorina starrii]|uniref:Uncharacterized protein n=1 Tax=Pleodorina starrii TaxID=330485 RepID=A0A9W6BSZ3_9CHLO|nr:hypothetical protein PLESTM_000208000 [Pleodorina starrii]GLC57669.1 hypothetical protein PLESTB_001251900 [Pleodorina starrii]